MSKYIFKKLVQQLLCLEIDFSQQPRQLVRHIAQLHLNMFCTEFHRAYCVQWISVAFKFSVFHTDYAINLSVVERFDCVWDSTENSNTTEIHCTFSALAILIFTEKCWSLQVQRWIKSRIFSSLKLNYADAWLTLSVVELVVFWWVQVASGHCVAHISNKETWFAPAE